MRSTDPRGPLFRRSLAAILVATLVGVIASRSDGGDPPPYPLAFQGDIVKGAVALSPDSRSRSFSKGTLHIYVEKIVGFDRPALVLQELVIPNLSFDNGEVQYYTFALGPFLPRPKTTYLIRALMDLDGNSKTSDGDYFSEQLRILTPETPASLLLKTRMK